MSSKLIIAMAISLFTLNGNAELMLDSIYGDFYNESGVNIQVFSGGCTNKDSFAVQKEFSKGVYLIYFYRVKPDLCKAYFKYGQVVNFSYEDLGLQSNDRFKVMNPRISPRVMW